MSLTRRAGTTKATSAAGGQKLLTVARHTVRAHLLAMFVVSEAEAAAIRAVYQQRGEFAAAVELRRLFPSITDNAEARECARTIAGWKPLPRRLRSVRLRVRIDV